MNTILKIFNILSDAKVDTDEKFVEILDFLNIGVAYINENNRIIKYNNTFLQFSGCKTDEIKDIDIFDLVAEEHKSLAQSKFLTKSETPYEIKARRKDGSHINVLIQGKNLIKNGKEIRIVIIKDLTTQRNIESQNSLLRKAVEELQESIIMTDVDGNIIYVNKFFEQITGYSKNEAIGKNPRILKSNFHPQEFYEEMWDTILSGKTWQGEFFNKKKNGEFYWERKVITPFTDETGSVLFFISSGIDITKEKNVYELLNKNKQKFEKLVKNAPIAIFSFDIGGKIEVINKRMLELLGSPGEEATKKINVLDFDLLKKIGLAQKFKESINKKETEIFEGEYVSKWGKKAYFRGHITPILNEDDSIDSIVVMAEDISLQKEYEKAILQAKEQAERNDKLKNMFIANMSHELRTPLNAIIGFSDLLRNDSDLNDDQKESVKYIYESGNHLLRLIEDLMNISKIEAGELKIEPSNFKFKTLIDEVIKYYEENIVVKTTNKNINLIVLKNEEVENLDVYFDKERVRQVLQNFLNNAFKFTNEGTITFGYEIKDNKYLFFYVKDTGIGIPDEKKDLVFQKFRQVNEDYTRRYEGSGLGLYIAKKLVEMMRGEIWFESEEGRGTTFYVKIPFVKNENEMPHKHKDTVIDEKDLKETLESLRILIAEDDLTSSRLLQQFIKCEKDKCKLVVTGKEVLEELEKDSDYNLILMDIRMPELNGLEATKIVKEKYPHIKIIVQTAHAFENEIEEIINAGADGYVTKPYRKDEIYAEIKRVLGI